MAATGDALDPLSGAGFDAVYEQAIKPELVRQEVQRGQAMLIFAATAIFSATLEIALSIFGNEAAGVFLIVGLVITGFSYLPLAFLASETKQKVISALCAPLGVTFEASPLEPPHLKRLRDLKLLPDSDDDSYEDRFRGRRAGCAFDLCEATLTAGSGKEQHDVFKGQIFAVSFPRRFLGQTVVLRDGGWMNRFMRPAAMQKVSLEDPVFERAFEVCGTDQMEARAILTPDFMEKLLALEARFSAQNLRCAFDGGQVLIALESPDRFEIGGMFSTLVDKRRVEGIARDLSAVFGLIDSFVGRGMAR